MPNLPDNLKAKLSRVYVAEREFTADDGKVIKYKRLVHQIMVKGDPIEIEFKADPKDLLILSLADTVDGAQL